MNWRKLIINLIPTTLIVGVVWFVFVTSRIILEEQTKPFKYNIPENTNLLVKIDGRRIIEKGISGLISSNNLNELSELFSSQESTDSKFKSSGINFQSDFIIVHFIKNGNPFLGILFQINSKTKFEKNLLPQLSSKFRSNTFDDQAIIFTSKIDNFIDQSNDEIKFVESREQLLFDLEEEDVNIKLIPQKGQKSIAGFKGEFSILANNSAISFKGLVEIKSKNESYSKHLNGLIPEGFHVTSSFIPDQFKNMLSEQLGMHFQELIGISLNHKSTTISNQSFSNFNLDSEVILTFSNKMSDSLIFLPLLSEEKITNFKTSSFEINSNKYFYHWLSDKQLYIGQKEFTKELIQSEPALFRIKGSPKYVTNIEGNQFSRSIIGMIPIYSASEELFSNIENVDVKGNLTESNEVKCNGVIRFKNGHSSFLEILKFTLQSNN